MKQTKKQKKFLLLTKTFFMIATLLGTSVSRAEEMPVQLLAVTAEPQSPAPPIKLWAMTLDMTQGRSLVDSKDGSFEEGRDLLLANTFAISREFSLGFKGGYSQDLRRPDLAGPSDLSLVMNKKFPSAGIVALPSLGLSAVLPTSKDSRENKELQGALGLQMKLTSKDGVLLNGALDIEARLLLSRSFHKHTIAADGNLNNQTSFVQGVSTSLNLPKKFTVTIDILHRYLWNYRNQMSERFGHSEEIGWEVSPTLSIYGGHDLGGVGGNPVIKANGESNISFLSETASTVYAGLRLNI